MAVDVVCEVCGKDFMRQTSEKTCGDACLAEWKRRYARGWREANPEKVREHVRKWREANPERVLESDRKRWARRRAARRREAEGGVPPREETTD